MNCPNCRQPIEPSWTFCDSCGFRLDENRGQAAGTASVPPARTSQPGGGSGAAAVPVGDALARPAPPQAQPPPPAGEGGPADQAAAAIDAGLINEMSGEPTFDPLRNRRLYWQMAFRFAIYAVVGMAVELVLLFFGFIFSLVGGLAVAAFMTVVSILVGIALFLVFWLLPVPAMLAQWSRLTSYQAPAAGLVFGYVKEMLNRHATPFDSLRIRPLALPGEGRRDYIELRYGVFTGYVSCFPHGHDLYVGWSFWIHISPFRLLIMRIGRIIQNFTGRGNDVYQTLRYESTRATVGAIHTCTLAGTARATGDDGPLRKDSLSVPIG
jgi:uncharacterized membrane protein (Fun14 family)